MKTSNYYDIEACLAEDELIPCTTLFDFSYLAHLDPDLPPPPQKDTTTASAALPENSRIKLPLWATEKWANLGFIRPQLPKHYAIKARERVEADPAQVDLRKKSERYFTAGRMIVHLLETSTENVRKAIESQGRQSATSRRLHHAQLAQLDALEEEATSLRKTLLLTYTGARLRRTLDWALSSVGDDVSMYTTKLTEMERRLFQSGALAAKNFDSWKSHGNRLYLPRPPPTTNTTTTTTSSSSSSSSTSTTTTPALLQERQYKRQRTQ